MSQHAKFSPLPRVWLAPLLDSHQPCFWLYAPPSSFHWSMSHHLPFHSRSQLHEITFCFYFNFFRYVIRMQKCNRTDLGKSPSKLFFFLSIFQHCQLFPLWNIVFLLIWLFSRSVSLIILSQPLQHTSLTLQSWTFFPIFILSLGIFITLAVSHILTFLKCVHLLPRLFLWDPGSCNQLSVWYVSGHV